MNESFWWAEGRVMATTVEKEQLIVLLVDDDVNLLKSLERDFRRAGVQTHSAISANEAWILLKHYTVDAVLVDNRMVGQSGASFLKELRRAYPRIERFMLSGDISPLQSTALCSMNEVNQIFEKPCDPSQIIEAIRQIPVPARGWDAARPH